MDILAAVLVTLIIVVVAGVMLAVLTGLPAPVATPSATTPTTARSASKLLRRSVNPAYIWTPAVILIALLVYLLAQPLWVVFFAYRERPGGTFNARQMYVRTCQACHGDKGLGVRLAPYLAVEDVAARHGFDPTQKDDQEALRRYLTDMIDHGHGMMPAWSEDSGGPLNNQQIEELVNLILAGELEPTSR